jgi:hypothetical protein
MNTQPYFLEKMSAEYQQRRMQEAEQSRLRHELRAAANPPRPIWCPLALALAAALIALGRRLQHAAEPQPKLACETC